MRQVKVSETERVFLGAGGNQWRTERFGKVWHIKGVKGGFTSLRDVERWCEEQVNTSRPAQPAVPIVREERRYKTTPALMFYGGTEADTVEFLDGYRAPRSQNNMERVSARKEMIAPLGAVGIAERAQKEESARLSREMLAADKAREMRLHRGFIAAGVRCPCGGTAGWTPAACNYFRASDPRDQAIQERYIKGMR